MKKSLIVSTVLILLIGFIAGWYFISKNNSAEENNDGSFFGLFPTQESSDLEGRQPFGTSSEFIGLSEDGLRVPAGQIQQVTEKRVAGATIFASSTTVGPSAGETGSSTKTFHLIRFVEMGTGYVYQINLSNGQEERISNTTIRKTQNAVFSNNGNYLVVQYEDEFSDNIKNYFVDLISTEQDQDIVGEFLPENIVSPDFSPNNQELAYILKTNSGSDVVIYDTSSGETEVVYSSPIKDWFLSWGDNQTVVLNTAPSYSSLGYVYALNTDTGGISKVLGNITGLNASVGSDLNKALYSFTSNGTVHSRIINGGGVDLDIQTFPSEKCIFSSSGEDVYCAAPQTIPQGRYPDAWYMGAVSFADQVWKIDTDSGLSRLLIYVEPENSIDVKSIIIPSDEKWILLENKRDFSLWVANIENI